MNDDRTERLAIWVPDLDRIPEQMRAGILPHLDLAKVHRVGQGEKNEEQPAVAFKCPLLQAALICDLIRAHDSGAGERPTELYLNRGGDRWPRVTYETKLTVMGPGGKFVLNPAVFADVLEFRVEVPAVVRPLRRG